MIDVMGQKVWRGKGIRSPILENKISDNIKTKFYNNYT